ncbi:MAG: DNA polymerase III subunit delta' [Halioglobus sp.]
MTAEELPATSVPLPWQSETWQRLYEQFEQQRLPHALLLTGVQHTGKSRLAMALARLLLCETPVAGHNCGQCHPCELSQAGSHGDFKWLEPEGKSRAIKVDQIREIVEFSGKTAGFGVRKVVVLAPAEAMNPNAANALLKSLEEPPANTYIILVCHRPQALPATVRSRCQRFPLPSPPETQSVEWLTQLTGDQASSEQLLSLAQGRPMLAASYYTAGDSEVAAAVPRALDALMAGSATVPDVSAVLAKLPVDDAVGQLGQWLQQLLRKDGETRQLGVRSRAFFSLLDEVHRLAAVLGAGSNPNPKLLLDSLLARFGRELGAR